MKYEARGWHNRGYLPHLEIADRAIGITFRLADSLPKHALEKLKHRYSALTDAERSIEVARQIAAYEDAGLGACHLRHPECARIVADSLRHFGGERYRLIEWCVMPNHVHVIFRLFPEHNFQDIVRSWKNFTSRRINELLSRNGRLWAADYFDRVMRDEDHLFRARQYVRMNPVKAGLCAKPEDWKWSSAYKLD